MKYFCTSFDRNFLVRGLALYRSLVAHAGPFQLWTLCFDDFTFHALETLALPGLIPIRMTDFELANPEVQAVRSTRSRIEYYFTCTPSLPLYVLERVPTAEVVTYLDADLYFFSSPAPLFKDLGAASVLIIEHRFPSELRHLEIYGRFNVGFLSFRNDRIGLECLRAWRAQCIEWCYDKLEGDRYADQKYLDAWPARFDGVVVCGRKGANLAPWNVAGYALGMQDGHVRVDSEPLIFYHFHQLKMLNAWICDPGVWRYGRQRYFNVIREGIYLPYLAALHAVSSGAGAAYLSNPGARFGRRSVLGSAARSLVRGQLLVSPGGFR